MDYRAEMGRVEVLLDQHRFKEAARQCADLLQTALNTIYDSIKEQARPAQLKNLLAVERGLAEAGTADVHDSLSPMIALCRQAQVLSLVESVLGRPLKLSRTIPLESFGDLNRDLTGQSAAGLQAELEFLCAQLRMFLQETGLLAIARAGSPIPPAHGIQETPCPACGEPLKAGWSFCPNCERPLVPPRCFQCNQPVKLSWKLCPECEVRLRCATCGMPFTMRDQACPKCSGPAFAPARDPSQWIEPLTGMTFVPIPAGVYSMGDTFGDGIDNERPAHDVRLRPFFMAIHPVTQQQWQRVMPSNPSAFKGELRPVERVTWHEAQAFAHRLSELNHGRCTLRLPTEAQWEYAARSGGKAERYAGGGPVDKAAWYDENSGGMTQPVGRKAPNGLGLFDMSGNVWEWCLDGFCAEAYAQHETEDPVIHDPGPDRVIRGGSWNLDAWSVRCARRMGFTADANGPGLGLRLVMLPDLSPAT